MGFSVPTSDDVAAAARRIAPWVVRTPTIENEELNIRVGLRVLLKLETLQRTGSFKFRGATNAIRQIPPDKRAAGVVAYSSGNHAQGVACAAALADMPATIVMPKDAPASKIDGTSRLGAQIVFYDRLTDNREAIGREIAHKKGATIVAPFDDAKVVAGQGTIGLELVADATALGVVLDAVVVPCGGGGLTAGIALALSTASPKTTVFAVEPERFNGMGLSLAAGKRSKAEPAALSIADALMAPEPGEIPFAVAKDHRVLATTVSDHDLAKAVSFAARRLKLVVEPGGAAGLGAVLARNLASDAKTIAVVLSGGNCDPTLLAQCCAQFGDP